MNRLYTHRLFPFIFIPISFLFLLIYSWATSPIFLGEGVDSSIFKTIGLGMTQGKMPYTDLFDHKGGLLFLIEALGCMVAPGRWGLFILQIVFMSSTLYILYKTALLFIDEGKAFGATMASLFLYVVFMESGNQCEFYTLPAAAGALYLALKFMTGENISTHPLSYSLAYGMAFAFSFWIRPNDAVSQIGAIMAGIFIFLLIKKEYSNAISNALSFLGGCIVASLPIIAFFAAKGCLYPLIEGTLLFNLNYVSESGLPSPEMILVPLFIFGVLIWIAIKDKQKNLNYIYIPMLILTLMLIGKRNYAHYLIIMIPSSLVLFSTIIRKGWKIPLCILLIGIAVPSVRQHRYVVKSFETRSGIEAFYNQTRRIIKNVPENERNEIWALNLLTASNEDKPNIYSTLGSMLDMGLTPCNRIFAYIHLEYFTDEEKVQKYMPKWILADPTGEIFGEYESFLSENYEIIDSTDGSCVGDVVLYKIKDEDK